MTEAAGPGDVSQIGTEFDFGGVKERIITRDDFSLERARQVLEGQTVAIVGYGVQGPGQGLNLKDNGVNVIVGQRPGRSFDKAVEDGWVPGRDLFSTEEAVQRADQVHLLLSDAGQRDTWEQVRQLLRPGMALVFSHGFSIVFKDQTGVVPPPDVDVFLAAPKGTGRSVRENFLNGSGINSSHAVFQDATGRAKERALATGIAIGSGFLFPTTFEKEVFSDLTGERGVLIGAFHGLAQASFDHLRRVGYSPVDSFTHTVEVATQTISKIIGERGADGLAREISAKSDLLTAFSDAFVVARHAVSDTFETLYERVATGLETAIVLEANSRLDYRERLNDELRAIDQSELGLAGHTVRDRRAQGETVPSTLRTISDAIMAGALVGISHAQYDLLRSRGHTPSEAFNETIEEATESLHPLIGRQGIDFLYANCSTTAQRGALDWNGIFRGALFPRLHRLYSGSVHPQTDQVWAAVFGSEMWRAGATVRKLRPQNQRAV